VLSTCPHCGRAVATEETLIRTRAGWLPSLCCNGESGPLPDGAAEPVKNHPLWYTAATDAGRRVLLTGPHPSYEAAAAALPAAIERAYRYDRRAPWFGYGVASGVNPRPVAFPEPVQ
jgi:hypothetical protein